MRNIIITGGELFNKGAQAMTFITVSELKRKFPNHRIFLLSELDKQRPEQERKRYNFEFMGWYPLKFARCQSNPVLRLACYLRNREELLEAEEIYKNTDLMVDISGYALGSNWSAVNCNNYLDHLEYAKAFHIPVYIMPQSFGPFDFAGEEGKKINERINELLPMAKVICAREQEGYIALLEKYRLDNVIRTDDLVLNSREIDVDAVFKKTSTAILPVIQPDSVAVIPNQRNFDTGNPEKTEQLYIYFIQEALAVCSSVYLLSHSTVDEEICKRLKKYFAEDERVVLLTREFDCIEFNGLVRNFRFIIASRFHAIVHAFKNGVPCIAIGWATKYHDLMALFEQEKYLVDVRVEYKREEIQQKVQLMAKAYADESKVIKSELLNCQKENVFNIIQN